MDVQDVGEFPRRSGASRAGGTDLSGTERAVSGAAGTLLGLWGLRHGGLGGIIGAIAGGALLARAATGHRLAAQSETERATAENQGWTSAAVTNETVTINRPRQQLYAFWRDFSNLPRVMSHVSRVEVLDTMRSRWTVAPGLGEQLEWTSLVTDDRPGERIAWEADADAQVRNSGWVEFGDAPGGLGTELRVQVAYEPPGGEIGRVLTKLWPRSPGALLRDDLHEFKRKVESGEIVMRSAGAVEPGQF
jgi:uncharacterized membrane protein